MGAHGQNTASAKLGSALTHVLKGKFNNQPIYSFYNSLSASQARGFGILVDAVRREQSTGKILKIGTDLNNIKFALANSMYDYDLPEFMDKVDEFYSLAKSLDGSGGSTINQDKARKVLACILAKVDESGITGRPYMTGYVGGIAEVIEIPKVRASGATVTKVQPNAVGDKYGFREAECFGGTKISGVWYLEVKNWPNTPPALGVENLKTQMQSHVRRSASLYTDANPDLWPGLLVKFAAPGQGADLDQYEAAIRTSISSSLKELLRKNEVLEDDIKTRIEQYMSRVVVEPPDRP